MGLLPPQSSTQIKNDPLRVLAVVLPQFHPIPENDKWWGKGFTEWRNVTKARPLFDGHYQPHLPGELGFYDLRLPETRFQQAELAKEHGISGFCYYHYWFNGKEILERPISEILSSRTPDFPFCLCWANENWTRAWDGRSREILLEQKYNDSDDIAHIRALAPYFSDKRYIRIGGKPLFIVYKVDDLPNPQRTFEAWRSEAIRLGIGEICLAQFEAHGGQTTRTPRDIGLDISIEFAPDWRNLGGRYYVTPKAKLAMLFGLLSKAYLTHRVCEYNVMKKSILAKATPNYKFLRCVSPGFDNSPRRPTNATILLNSTPESYEDWLRNAIHWTRDNHTGDMQIVFVNAWNEWAEGNHLEPDEKYGRAYLQATLRAIQDESLN